MPKIPVQALPIAIIVECVLAAIVYGMARQWRMCIYWASAAILQASVTF